jgi:glycosyltransferase involved in cell wall biosynthesis
MINIVMFSNYPNNHVNPLCDALSHVDGVNFAFVGSVDDVDEEKIKMGFLGNVSFPYVTINKDKDQAYCYLQEADLIIYGDGDPKLVQSLMKDDAVVFQYSEHFSKNINPLKLVLKKIHHYYLFHAFDKRGGYLLATSSYAKGDFSSSCLYRHKALYWGYFPLGNMNEDLSDKKISKDAPIKLLWAERLVGFKRVEYAVKAADILFRNKIPFELEIVGDGEKMAFLKSMLADKPYLGSVKISGRQDNAYVLNKMKEDDVFLFTSDKGEGWGAGLNEAMSSKCVVLASSLAGSTAFLVKDGINGYTFNDDEEYEKKLLLIAKERGTDQLLADNAYMNIKETWNAQVAAKNLVMLYIDIKKGVEPTPSIEPIPGKLIA